jgi:hypothetical protein
VTPAKDRLTTTAIARTTPTVAMIPPAARYEPKIGPPSTKNGWITVSIIREIAKLEATVHKA